MNFPPRQIATFFSEVLVLGVPDADGQWHWPSLERSVAEGLGKLLSVRPGELRDRLAIPVQSQPAQSIDNGINRLLGGSRPIGIFDPEQETPAVMPGV